MPQRGRGEPTTPSIPAGVVAQLLSHGVEESAVRQMSRADDRKAKSDLVPA